MKFDKIPLNHFFRFLDEERSSLVHQKISPRTIRNVDIPGTIITYRRNEEVQYLSGNIKTARETPIDTFPTFKDVPVNHFFRFKDTLTAYRFEKCRAAIEQILKD